jgi:hypothetical protein
MNVTYLIEDAMDAVQRCGASRASSELAEALFKLAKARDHVRALEAANIERAELEFEAALSEDKCG